MAKAMRKEMHTSVPDTEPEVRALLDLQSKAMGAKDIDRLMALYSPDVVYFDVVPPLQFVGSDALRRRFQDWFDNFKGPMEMETRDLHIAANADSAVACWLSRAKGTLQNGQQVGTWVRATSCCQWSDDKWLITHEHVSIPVDLKSGKPAMDLVP
jgi:ketosteroid isomerase-like protein